MGIKKDILEEIKEVKIELQEFIGQNKRKINHYDEIMKHLGNIKIQVSKVNLVLNDKGDYEVVISYKIPNQVVRFDDEGEIIENPRFIAINALDLISIKDMNEIQKMLMEAEKRNGRRK